MNAILQTPYSEEAEEATLGAILVNPDVFVSLLAVLKPDDFFILRHRYIWEAMTRLHERNEPIDLLLLIEALKSDGHLLDIGGPAYLTQLSNRAPNSQHGAIYGTLVEKMAVRRRLMAAADRIKSLALDTELTVEDITEQIGKMVYSAMTLRPARDPVHRSGSTGVPARSGYYRERWDVRTSDRFHRIGQAHPGDAAGGTDPRRRTTR
jgi:replicative DNA helicase